MLLSPSPPHPYLPCKTPHPSPLSFLSPPLPLLQAPKPLYSFLRVSLSSNTNANNQALAKSAIHRIAEKLRSLGYIEESPQKPSSRTLTGPGSPGEIFIPTPADVPNCRVGHTIDPSWSTPEHPVPEPGAGISRLSDQWRERTKPRAAASAPSVAELTIPPAELKRLRGAGLRLEKRLKVGKAGITEGIVNGIHERWRRSELVKIKCEDLCRMNMKRTHEILERKTGGLVVWRSGSIIILYRGANYKYPYFFDKNVINESLNETSMEPSMEEGSSGEQEGDTLPTTAVNPSTESSKISVRSSLVIGVGSPEKLRLQLPGEIQVDKEADRLLDGLGPRFTDWWGSDPLPVDADLLPAIVPGYRKPFRLLPFGVRPKLTDREMTILRRLSRPLPCHFALGRNRNLQGLAVSMIKLWERCEVAKIAVKRGVQNTNSEIMVEELKQLTGGTLLSRDKEFIIFYRGKDFLPPAVSITIEERRKSGTDKQKQNADEFSPIATMPVNVLPRVAFGNELQEAAEDKRPFAMERGLKSRNPSVKAVETKLSLALKKKEKAEKLLAELEKTTEPSVIEPDKEGISEEERYMLRKIGLRMKPFLLLGRRGVFDGTVENMHLHWKYRELVKIISNDCCIEHVESAAQTLETESGGILVAVERVSKGYAIIVYRGKNYHRPAVLRPRTLLNRREAMKRSLEAQRYESLKLHVLSLSKNIDQLKEQMISDSRSTTSVESTEFVRSIDATEMRNHSGSTQKDLISADLIYHEENVEKVQEAEMEALHLHEYDCISCGTGEATTLNEQDKPVDLKHVDEFSETTDMQSFYGQEYNTNVPDNGIISSSDEAVNSPGALVASSMTNIISHASYDAANDESPHLSIGASQSKSHSSVCDAGSEVKHDIRVPFKAAPLSNRERLILRKQALKMRKRPVIAVGKSNAITGVAKTIMTHFQKHPLAIVNIKGRAKGTSAQEVIFELEQATGAVLVSREPNKVILYRGWGEGEVPGLVEREEGKIPTRVNDVVSHQLMEAIRLECELQTKQVEEVPM